MRPNPERMDDRSRKILGYSVNAVAEMMEQDFPETWKLMYTKSIDSPAGFYSSRALAVGLTGAIEECRNGGQSLESNVGIIAGLLEQHNFPIYYVGAPLIEALKHSHPPDNIQWKDVKLPFISLCFMLPRGSVFEDTEIGGNEVILVGVAKFPPGASLHIPTFGTAIVPSEGRISVFWTVGPSGIIVNDVTFPPDHFLEPMPEWIDKNKTYNEYMSGKFCSRIAGLVANLVLVMEARKELIEHGSRISKSKREGKPDRWLPTFIGRKYAVLHKGDEDPAGKFTELGWRCGHFKRQHFGPKNEQVKTIFVEPYIAFTRCLKPIDKAEVA